MRRGYVVTKGNSNEAGQWTQPILHRTTCYREAGKKAKELGCTFFTVVDDEVIGDEACKGCTAWCGPFKESKKRRKKAA